MKICITSQGDSLDSKVDPRFGRCAFFIIWDNDSGNFEAIANPNVNAGSGAGIQSAQLVATKQISMLITGEVGPKAEQVLKGAQVQIIAGASGTIKEVIAEHINSNVTVNTNDDLQNVNVASKPRNQWFRNFACRWFGFGGRSNRNRGAGRGPGPGDFCICPNCGEKQPHQRGVPCNSVHCLKCNSIMMRE